MSKMIKKKNKNKGFTLIEILVAVLILAILVAIALPTYNRAVERSRTSDPINTLKSIAKAEQVQRLRVGEYTNQTQELDLQLTDYPAGNTVAGDTFEGQYYTYTVYGEDEAAATAARKGASEGEEDFYELSVDYGTGEIFCRPATNKTCIDLGLEEGRDFDPKPVRTTCDAYMYGFASNSYSCDSISYKDGKKVNVVCYLNQHNCYWYNEDKTRIATMIGLNDGGFILSNIDPETNSYTYQARYSSDGSLYAESGPYAVNMLVLASEDDPPFCKKYPEFCFIKQEGLLD